VVVSVPEQRFTAEQLGRMTDAELDRIRHCRRCLEPYDRCGCREGAERRREQKRVGPVSVSPVEAANGPVAARG
jgi:hypothetical protein